MKSSTAIRKNPRRQITPKGFRNRLPAVKRGGAPVRLNRGKTGPGIHSSKRSQVKTKPRLAARGKATLRVKKAAPSINSRRLLKTPRGKTFAKKRFIFRRKRRIDTPDIWKRYARHGAGSKVESEITQQYLPLVKTVVGRLAMTLPAHAATEDLYSAGLVGLLNAIRRYNPRTGVLFETYARVRIRGNVFDELRRLDWVPRSVHDKARKVEVVMRSLEQKHGHIPSNMQMAKAMNMSEDDYEHLLNTIKPATFVCLDSVRSAEQEGEATQHEAVADSSQPDPGHATARREMARIIVKRLKHLPEVQRKVLALYYFEDLRLREIAEVFGVTESRISQIHAAAVLNIRAYLARHDTIRNAA